MEFMFVVALILGALAWFFPALVAGNRNHPSATAISILCGVAPFTAGISWIVALVWAYNGQRKFTNITVTTQPATESGVEARLIELDDLLSRGVITQDEYDRSRSAVLGLV
ncbi:MAG: hypothetical protein RIS25_416 [Actinomycetota bacterium]|mgnify:CR=1 FL=1|jgi:Superinfection immunity protein